MTSFCAKQGRSRSAKMEGPPCGCRPVHPVMFVSLRGSLHYLPKILSSHFSLMEASSCVLTKKKSPPTKHSSAFQSEASEALPLFQGVRYVDGYLPDCLSHTRTALQKKKSGCGGCSASHKSWECLVEVQWHGRFSDCVLALLSLRQ